MLSKRPEPEVRRCAVVITTAPRRSKEAWAGKKLTLRGMFGFLSEADLRPCQISMMEFIGEYFTEKLHRE